jgi:biotin carboxyl carrier protein
MLLDATVDGRTLRVLVRGKDGHYTVTLDGKDLEVDLCDTGSDFVSLLIEGRSHEAGLVKRAGGYAVVLADDVIYVDLAAAAGGEAPAPKKIATGPLRINAPMPGKVIRLLVGPGDQVAVGAALLVVEAMKMENEMRAPRAGRVRETAVREGQTVETGALLVVLE